MRSIWEGVAFFRSTWPVWRKPINCSPKRTGTAVSTNPNWQVTVAGSNRALSESCCCICRQVAQDRLFSATMAHKGFSWRLPWWGNCHDSTGRNETGRPVVSLNAFS